MATATKDKLATLEGLKALKDGISIPSVSLQIPTGQWSGTGPYTYDVNVTNVTADTTVEAQLDNSINYLTGDLTVTSGAGKLTLSTTKLPTGTLNVTVFFPGVHSDVVVQVLADVYSKSQTYSKSEVYTKAETNTAIAQSTAKIKASASTLSHLESVIVALGSPLADHDSLTGNVRVNFADATLGFNGAICECTIQRTANGVYLATFITTASDVITDYYYSNTHHWSSSKQSMARFGTASINIIRENKTSFTWYGLNAINDSAIYKHGLLVWGVGPSSADTGLAIVFVSTTGEVTINNVSGTSRTFTGTVSGTGLTITANATVYGGLKLIWLT